MFPSVAYQCYSLLYQGSLYAYYGWWVMSQCSLYIITGVLLVFRNAATNSEEEDSAESSTDDELEDSAQDPTALETDPR